MDFGPVTDAGFLFLFFSDAIRFETENGNETPALIKQQGGVWTQTQQKKLDLGVNYLFIGISCRATYWACVARFHGPAGKWGGSVLVCGLGQY